MRLSEHELISSYPISPAAVQKRSIWLTPVFNEFLGAIRGTTPILPVNVMHSFHERDSQDVLLFREHAEFMGVRQSLIHADVDRLQSVFVMMAVLFDEGHLSEQQRSVVACDCGAVYELADVFATIPAPRLVNRYGGRMTCRQCGSELRETDSPVLVLQVPEQINLDAVHPGYARKEMASVLERVRDGRLLVSRKRDTGIPFGTHNTSWFLDVDVANACLSLASGAPRIVQTATHKQSFLQFKTMIFANYCVSQRVDSISLPYILPAKNSVSVDDALNSLPTGVSRSLALLCSSRLQRKEVKFDFGLSKRLSKLSPEECTGVYSSMVLRAREILGCDFSIEAIVDRWPVLTNIKDVM